MKLAGQQPNVRQLELLVWAAVFIVVFFTLLPEDGFLTSTCIGFINTLFYAIIIYGNINWLFLRLFARRHYILYACVVIFFLVIIGISRCYAIIGTRNLLKPLEPEKVTFTALANFTIAGLLIFVLSFVFRIALAYFAIKEQSEKILLQKGQAELSLLKSQVQPHFLFNTLNNINYILHKEAPESAVLIERLADIMRYFVEESPKEKVAIHTEVNFLENYIELERIRIRFKTEIDFIKQYSESETIPPMLLITFVENIFKHGIDKSSSNKISISLIQQSHFLIFETNNKIISAETSVSDGKFGLQNLRQRLYLLYGGEFDLRLNETGDNFHAFLKIPVS